MGEAAVRLYEQAAVRQVAGNVLRPGGLTLTRRALTVAALPSGARTLDVGCGVGTTVSLCRSDFALNAFGLDLSAILLAEGRAQDPPRPLLQATALQLPFADGAFEAVLAECSLSLMTDWNQALSDVARVLRPGGLCIVSDVYAAPRDGTPVTAPLQCCLAGARSRDEIEAQFTTHGFTLWRWEDHTPALKQFAARLIWEHGSLAAFWDCAGVTQTARAALPAHPGYFLAWTRKGSKE